MSQVRPQQILLLGAGVGAVLTAAATAAALTGLWWLVVLAGMALLSLVLLVALDIVRRVRETRRFLQGELRRLEADGGSQGPPAPTADDVVGTVRALQAQYTGRLDRLQDAVDEVLGRDERR